MTIPMEPTALTLAIGLISNLLVYGGVLGCCWLTWRTLQRWRRERADEAAQLRFIESRCWPSDQR